MCVPVCVHGCHPVWLLVVVVAIIGYGLLRHRRINAYPLVTSLQSSSSINGVTTGRPGTSNAHAVHPPSGSTTDPESHTVHVQWVRHSLCPSTVWIQLLLPWYGGGCGPAGSIRVQVGTRKKWWVMFLAFALFLFQVVPTVCSTARTAFCCFTLMFMVVFNIAAALAVCISGEETESVCCVRGVCMCDFWGASAVFVWCV